MNTIWLRPSCSAKSAAECATRSAERLFTTNTWGTAPAASNARAESYSQLVPGNTGISTRGLAIFARGRVQSRASNLNA